MKRTIRRGVFETNSSSMHSLVITNDDKLISTFDLTDGMSIDAYGVWNIWNDDELIFGRSPFQYLSTFESKVRYAIASLCRWADSPEEKFEEIKQIVTEVIPECHDIKLPSTNYVDNGNFYGGVDEDILSGFLTKNDISLKDFVLNNKYKVIVDGDEYCIYNDLKKSNLINQENIVLEFPERGVL